MTERIDYEDDPDWEECEACVGTKVCVACDGAGECPHCLGLEFADGSACEYCSGTNQCTDCDGTGECDLCDGKGYQRVERLCPRCNKPLDEHVQTRNVGLVRVLCPKETRKR